MYPFKRLWRRLKVCRAQQLVYQVTVQLQMMGFAALALIVIVNVLTSFAPIRPHCVLVKGLQDMICFIFLWDVGSVVSPDCQGALWLQYTACFWIKCREMEPA